MCEYCEEGKEIEERPDDNISLTIYGKHLRLLGKLTMYSVRFGRDILINYCPMCGRRLS